MKMRSFHLRSVIINIRARERQRDLIDRAAESLGKNRSDFMLETSCREAESILFEETPAHSSFDWHNDPIPQYVITLAGVLEFTTVGGETFIIHPGDVLLAVDHTGSGHKWRFTNDEPWKRAYVVFKEGADTHFVPDHT